MLARADRWSIYLGIVPPIFSSRHRPGTPLWCGTFVHEENKEAIDGGGERVLLLFLVQTNDVSYSANQREGCKPERSPGGIISTAQPTLQQTSPGWTIPVFPAAAMVVYAFYIFDRHGTACESPASSTQGLTSASRMHIPQTLASAPTIYKQQKCKTGIRNQYYQQWRA